MTTITLELSPDLVAHLEHVADEQGQPVEALIADALTARFASGTATAGPATPPAGGRIRLRPVALTNWPPDTTFRRQEIYGDDAR